jgi:hypothetical protein
VRGLLSGIAASLLVAVVAVIVVLAIGEDSDRPIKGDSGAVEDGSGGAVLTWWRLLRAEAPVATIESRYAPSAHVTARELRKELPLLLYYFREATPRIVHVDEGASRSTVLTVFAGRNTDLSHYFKLVREGSRWKLADNSYLRTRAAAERTVRTP